MAPKKATATAKSPTPKRTTRRQAKPEVVEVSSDASSNYDNVPDLDGEEAQDDAGSADDSGPEPVAATPARKGGKRKATDEDGNEDVGSPGAKKPRVSSVKISESVTESGGKRKQAHRNVKVEIPVSTTPVTKPAGKHIVFNDDDGPAEFYTPQEAPAQGFLDAQLAQASGAGRDNEDEDEDDEGSDSDDDAPEAVSSHAAAAQAAKSAQAATKAAEKQFELQKRKRQERDARLKQQAETRKKNQAASGKKAAAAAAEEASPEPAEQAPGRRDNLPSVTTAPARKRLDRRALPDVLPDDFLEAASDDDDDDDDDDDNSDDQEDDAARRPKKPKANTLVKQMVKAESRRPQDVRVGSTVYRVAGAGDDNPFLAPKMGKNSRNTREMLLRRQRPVARKGGFLVKKRR